MAPDMLRIAVVCSLQDKDRHNRELIICLKQDVLGEQESRGAVDEPSRIVDRRTEVAGGTGAILNAKGGISGMPFKSLMAYSECVGVAGLDYFANGRRGRLSCDKIKPSCRRTPGTPNIL